MSGVTGTTRVNVGDQEDAERIAEMSKAREFLEEYNRSNNYGIEAEDLLETLKWESETVYEEEWNDRRWWMDIFKVVRVNSRLIGYMDARTTGDDSPTDKGWEFDPSTICDVVEKVVTKTVYERVPEAQKGE